MNWRPLTTEAQIDTLREESFQKPILIYKHSTTCSISSTTLNRLERNWNGGDLEEVQPYFLDLLRYRPVSAAVAQAFGVTHQSPQVLLIRNGECVYDASHFEISYPALRLQIEQLTY